jgi:hypothetical protein
LPCPMFPTPRWHPRETSASASSAGALRACRTCSGDARCLGLDQLWLCLDHGEAQQHPIVPIAAQNVQATVTQHTSNFLCPIGHPHNLAHASRDTSLEGGAVNGRSGYVRGLHTGLVRSRTESLPRPAEARKGLGGSYRRS